MSKFTSDYSRLTLAVVGLAVSSLIVCSGGCGNKDKQAPANSAQAVEAQAVTQATPAHTHVEGQPVGAVLMEVDQEIITTCDALDELSEQLQTLGKTSAPEAFRQRTEAILVEYLRQRVAEILLMNQAKAALDERMNQRIEAQTQAHKNQLLRQCDNSPTRLRNKLRAEGKSLESELENYRQDLEVRIFLTNEFASRINVSREDMVSYYQKNIKQYSQPKRVELLKIQVLDHKHVQEGWTDQQVRQEVLDIAEHALEMLRTGQSFSEVARKYSDIRPEQGGNWGMVDPESLAQASERKAAKELGPGEFSQVLQTDIGCSIVGVGRIEPARQESLEQVQEQISQVLWNQQYRRFYNQRISELGRRAVISASPTAMALAVDLAQQRFQTANY